MTDRFIGMEEVIDRVGFSKTHIYRLMNAGQFPRTVPVGRFKIAFLESEIDEWMDERLRARERGEGAEARRERAYRAESRRAVHKA